MRDGPDRRRIGEETEHQLRIFRFRGLDGGRRREERLVGFLFLGSNLYREE